MSVSSSIEADFETRWAAWQKRGREHDRLVATRLRIALPGVALILIAGSYLLFR